MHVDSLAAPNANLTRRTTFSIVERPIKVDTVRTAAVIVPNVTLNGTRTSNVMLNNTIVDQMVRNDIQRAFESRGYRMTKDNPDFVVAYYAKARTKLEIDGDAYYGYRYNDCCYVEEFTEGLVVVDAVDPHTKELLWRGSATARVSDNPRKYVKQLCKAVDRIVDRFPVAGSAIYVQQ